MATAGGAAEFGWLTGLALRTLRATPDRQLET
jgi:hypothetical protein